MTETIRELMWILGALSVGTLSIIFAYKFKRLSMREKMPMMGIGGFLVGTSLFALMLFSGSMCQECKKHCKSCQKPSIGMPK